MVISEDVKKAYFNALYNQENGSIASMAVFRATYPNEYSHLNGMRQRRTKIRRDLKIMTDMNKGKVYFGTLTFDDKHDKSDIANKRKQVFRHLNTLFVMFFVVEELGAENGRYHIHFCGVFREGRTFNDFFKWHSRTDISKVKRNSFVVNYLCDYVAKQVPRIRRNKTMIECSNSMKRAQMFRRIGFDGLAKPLESKAYECLFLSDLV